MKRAMVMLAGLSAACGSAQTNGGTSVQRPATPDEAAAVQNVVFDGQRAGFVRHDADAYLAQWHDEARLVAARQEQPGQYELSLDRAQIEATKRMRFRGPSIVLALNFEDARVTVAGDEATMHVHTSISSRGASEATGEIYRLRRTADGWRVFENRYWRVSSTFNGEPKVFDSDYYEAVDRRVEAARAAGDEYEVAVALLDAGRFSEALAAFRELTAEDAEPYELVLRGMAAVSAGDVEDAKASFASALELDPAAPLPAYAR